MFLLLIRSHGDPRWFNHFCKSRNDLCINKIRLCIHPNSFCEVPDLPRIDHCSADLILDERSNQQDLVTTCSLCDYHNWALEPFKRFAELLDISLLIGNRFRLFSERQAEKYRRMGPLSRPMTRSGQWSQTTTGISQPAARLSVGAVHVQLGFRNINSHVREIGDFSLFPSIPS